MRTVTRTGISLSVVAALALYGVQLVAGLAAMTGVVVVGVIAGLCVAKWLERPWYGRQLEAGARAGAIACGVAGLSAALYLLGQSSASMYDLAARSRPLGASFTSFVLSLSPLGPVGAIIASAVVATLLGIASSALTAQLFAWGKDKHSVTVVEQARLAAQAGQPGDFGSQMNSTGERVLSPSVQLYGRTGAISRATSGPIVRQATGAAPRPALPAASTTFNSWDDEADPNATQSGAKQKPAAKRGKAVPPRHTSHARSADEAISPEERSALRAWEQELGDNSLTGLKPREPKKSAFLNDPIEAPAPRRNRKKNNTRDWLC